MKGPKIPSFYAPLSLYVLYLAVRHPLEEGGIANGEFSTIF